MKQVQSAVQSAYELSTLTPSVDPNEDKSDNTKKIDPVLEAIKTAPNRANKLTLDKNDVTGEVKGQEVDIMTMYTVDVYSGSDDSARQE